MQAVAKSGLTKALEELTTLLPKALECCSGTEPSQNSPIVEKLRSVLLELIQGCLTCNAGKHIVAVLRILQLVLEKLPATFAEGAHRAALVHMVMLLQKLPDHQEAVGEQLLVVLCSLSNMLAEQDTELLEQLHAGTVDLLFDLEQVLFALSTAAAQGQQVAAVQVSLFPSLLDGARQQQDAPAAAGWGEGQTLDATVNIQDGKTWEAFAQLALRLLLHQLQESPTLLGGCSPAGVLVSALGQMMTYSSASLQELCLSLMALLVLQQPHQADMVPVAANYVLWMLQCAGDGQLPAELLCAGSMQALTACVSACTAALHGLGLLGLFCDRLLHAAGKALLHPATQTYAPLWLSLVQQALSLSPQHAGTAALVLPLRVGTCAAGAPSAAQRVALDNTDQALLETWRQVAQWLAAPDTRDTVQQQLLALQPSLKPSVRQQRSQASGDLSGSPGKNKKRRKQGADGPQKKYRQMQFAVTEGGFVSSQRPSKGSSQPTDTNSTQQPPAAAAGSGQSAAHSAIQAMQQLLELQPAAAAAARLAALLSSLAPDASIPVELLPALGVCSKEPPTAAAAAAARQAGADAPVTPTGPLSDALRQAALSPAPAAAAAAAAAAGAVDAKARLEMLLLLLQSLSQGPQQCPALVSSLSQQVVACVNQSAGNAQLLPLLLQALLLALTATVNSIAAEPRSVDMHVRVWQHAQDTLQGSNNIFSSNSQQGSPGLWAAAAVSWLAATRLMGWCGSSAVNNAAAQLQHATTSSSGCGDGSSAAAGVLLLPVLSVLQHMHFSDSACAFVPPGATTAAAAGRGKAAVAAAVAAAAAAAGGCNQEDTVMVEAQQQETQEVVLDTLMQGCEAAAAAAAAGGSSGASAVQMAALMATSHLLQLQAAGTTAAGFAALLHDATQRVLSLCCGATVAATVATPRAQQPSSALGALGVFSAPCLVPFVQANSGGDSTAGGIAQLPPLQQLLPVLEAALQASEHPQLQAATVQLLSSYLRVVSTPTLLYGTQELLLDALTLLTARDGGVRDAALGLVRQYLQEHVLVAVCGGEQTAEEAVAAATQAAAEFQEAAVAVATQPQRRLLQHLQELLSGCDARAGGGGAEAVVAAKTALMRATAGLFGGLLGSGCEDIPLLQLLQQINDDAQVSSVALELLQHLAAAYTVSKEVDELLLEGPAATALLTAVGRSLQTQPSLFHMLAQLCKLDKSQLAEAVAPHTVQWLCQHQLKEPLELLASKLGQAPSTLLLGAADAVIAHMLWFSLDSLERFTQFVEGVMHPETFIAVVTVCGRKIVRRVVQLAGLPCFWEGQYQPPASLLTRAKEYVGILASILELPQPAGTIELLQGEPIALLLKSIGNALSKSEEEGGAAAPVQQRQAQPDGQQRKGKGKAGQASTQSLLLSGVAADKLQSLRALVVLMNLLGQHLGTHALQMMAVLSESLLYCTHGPLRMQALSAWLCFVQLLARHAPQVLERIAAQAAVVLLPVLEPADSRNVPSAAGAGEGPSSSSGQDDVDTAAVQLAAQVLHAIVVQHRSLVRAALQNMPPLPSLAVLKEVNAVLIQEQGRQSPMQQLQLLMTSLRHESIAVRHVALGEMRSFLLTQKAFISDTLSGLVGCSTRPALHGPRSGQPAPAACASAAVGAGKSVGSEDVKLRPVQCQDLLSELLAALLASCENLGRDSLAASMQQRCAQCLGLLGAIDPSRVQPQLPRPSPFTYDGSTFLVVLVQEHLVRVLQTASDISQLEMTSYALQQILQHFTAKRVKLTCTAMHGTCSTVEAHRAAAAKAAREVADMGQGQDASAAGGLYSLLDERHQSIVAPFLTTRFTQNASRTEGTGVVFGSHHHTFRRWLYLWLKQLAAHATGPLAAAFEACRGVTYWDQPLMLYLLPYMVVEAAGQGGEPLQMVAQEIHAVMQCAASGQNAQDPGVFVSDIELYLQCIFTQLDLLQQWVQQQQELCEKAAEQAAAQQQQQKSSAGSRSSSSSNPPEVQLPPFVANVAALVSATPIQTMAQAALKCGAFARALQYFEIFVRQQHGGGLNPSAYLGGCSSYGYDEVSFLLEVYGHLEEPDGIVGLAQLRQGGLTSTDQILVAEKAGAWSEALALYEQALSQEASATAAASSTAAAAAAPADRAGGRQGSDSGAADEAHVSVGRLGAAAADVLINAACAVVSGLPPSSAGAQQQHRLSTWLGLEQLQPAANLAGHAAGAGVVAVSEGAGRLLDASQACISSLQVGHLRCLLQMGHQQTLLRQVDGLMARCLGQAAAVAVTPAAVAGQAVAAAAAASEGTAEGALQAVQWSLGQLAALGVAAAWRLGAWDQLRGYLSVLEAAGNSPDGVLRPLSAADRWECCMGAILEAAQRGSHKEVMSGLHNARAGVLSLLPAIAGESYSRAYPDLLKLHMLQELEDAWALQKASPAGMSRHQRTKGLRWSERLDVVSPLLSSCEPLLALRRQLCGLMHDADGMGRCWLQHAKLCRATGHQEAAETSVLEAQARGVPGALLERCRLLWARDKGHRAMLELQLALQQQLDGGPERSSGEAGHQHAKEMLQLTEWMAAVGQGDKDMLCENYRESIMYDSNWEKAHFAFGRYLDQLYTDAKQREGKPAQAKGQDRLGGRSRIKVEEDNPYSYLSEALKHYGESVRLGHKAILQSLPRLLTLYFEFGSKVAATKNLNQRLKTAQTQVTGVMHGLIRSIPTYKWLLVLPQLTSRMCHVQPDVQEFMQQLLVAIVQQFPHQALWAMAVVVKSTIRARQESATAVLQAAKRRSSESGKRLFENFQRLTDQLIKTCMWQPPPDRRSGRCSAQKEFGRLVNLLPVEVMMPVQALFTVDLPPRGKLPPGHRPVVSQTYIAGMRDEVLIMSSLMKPKKITFVGSDGLDYPFLAKPKDDLRKDYRLMDFAGTTNALLARTPGARRRGLALRTYAVLPLTDDCGILQWVNNLMPFKAACEEIYVKEKMWKRHRTPMQIKLMYDNHPGPQNAALLDQVLKLLPPRMSKWMLGKFTDPGTWLAARLAFTRTNAAWAMVGHVLGLGDRHGENIMIDGLTGETVHVDFGCLFDRGLVLEVPERVPFRMTQNVIDCFGVSGVEGTFRRAAEMTLQVLRDNRPTLMTCAETFLHDPLVDWTSGKRSSVSAAHAGGPEAENPQAKDALHVMDGRLSGTLLGVLSTPSLPLSVEGQAARLIDEATDHENLGRMYIWWMPWL